MDKFEDVLMFVAPFAIVFLIGVVVGGCISGFIVNDLAEMVCLEEGFDKLVSYDETTKTIKCAYIKEDVKPYDGGWIQEVNQDV